MRDFRDAKAMAKALREAMAEKQVEISHAQALELVAAQFGYDNWNILAAKIEVLEPKQERPEKITIQPAIPIFRIFSVEKAMEFYRDFLGFTVDWEHRFAPTAPLYCQVSRSGMLLHLSEHAGDASPGARVFVPISGAEAFQKELIGKNYPYMRPGLEQAPWGLEVSVTDPFSNRITFCEREIKPAND
ncbi:glyoxalase superfamily protein [Neorhizobium alkalisoli]|jgi:hypothetical protein|uniref:Glyoxalase-related protein domain-containing protein n=1 Tax=Neorhizobium alkalisoli TaxID=528178 RepID=A0A561QRM8_9HYPH|nr:glyoxalase superfamily protein [Neorhizobium alkalisoli]TWF53045.1 hypothetical protein FHW37_104316 [Neorhizobium alkalisoli]